MLKSCADSSYADNVIDKFEDKIDNTFFKSNKNGTEKVENT